MKECSERSRKARAREPRWKPVGTAWQVDSQTKGLAKVLQRESRSARRTAARMEKLAAKIEANRLAGRTLDCGDVLAACRFTTYARWSASRLVGLESWSSFEEICDAIYPRTRWTAAEKNEPSPSKVTSAAVDVLAQATAIAQSARSEDIDWSREPLTERERKIRNRFLEGSPITLDLLMLELMNQGKEPASDLRRAIDENHRRIEETIAKRRRDKYREIANEIDEDDG